VLQNVSPDELTLQGLEASHVDFKTGAGKFDLVLAMTDAAKGLTGTLEYNTNLFDRATIERMLGHFQMLLESVAINPQQKISDVANRSSGACSRSGTTLERSFLPMSALINSSNNRPVFVPNTRQSFTPTAL
jgi:non-ribosomal peptide synthetase component F